jgi:hypothetical protein
MAFKIFESLLAETGQNNFSSNDGITGFLLSFLYPVETL